MSRLRAVRKDNCRTQPTKKRTKNNYCQSMDRAPACPIVVCPRVHVSRRLEVAFWGHEVVRRTCTFLSVWKPPRLIFVFDIETPHHDVQIPRLCAIRKDNCRTQPAKRRTKNNYQQSCTWVSDTTALEVRSETSAQSKSTPRADDSQTARSRNTCRGSSLAHHPQTTTLLVPRIPSTPPGPSTRFLRV